MTEQTKEKRRLRARLAYAKDPDKYRAKQKRLRTPEMAAGYNRKCVYGLSSSDHQKLFAYQGGKCAICGLQKRLVIDHDHATGKVRGLICYRCNFLTGVIENGLREKAAILSYLFNPPGVKLLA